MLVNSVFNSSGCLILSNERDVEGGTPYMGTPKRVNQFNKLTSASSTMLLVHATHKAPLPDVLNRHPLPLYSLATSGAT
jgi:hypothetical protein